MAGTTEMIVKIELDDEVRAMFEEARRHIDLMRPVAEASVALFDCWCDHGSEEQMVACWDAHQAWDAAVLAYNRLLAEGSSDAIDR